MYCICVQVQRLASTLLTSLCTEGPQKQSLEILAELLAPPLQNAFMGTDTVLQAALSTITKLLQVAHSDDIIQVGIHSSARINGFIDDNFCGTAFVGK